MKPGLPSVDFTERLEGRGVLYGPSDRVRAHHIVIERSKYRTGSDLTIDVRFEELDYPRHALFFRAGQLGIHGRLNTGQPFRVPVVYWTEAGQSRLTGTIEDVLIGEDRFRTPPDEQWLTATVTSTPIAPPTRGFSLRSWTGEVTSDTEYPPQRVQTKMGVLEFCEAFQFDDVSVSGIDSWVRVPSPTISLHLKAPHTSRDVGALLSTFRSVLDELAPVLSFMGRQWVVWTTIRLSAHWAGPPAEFSDATILRYARQVDSPQHMRRYVVPGRLGERDMDTVVKRLRLSPYRQAIRRAIVFLLASGSSGSIEQKVLNAFTALEALADGFSEIHGLRQVLSDKDFKSLRAVLQQAASNHMQELGLESSTRDTLYRKLSGLNTAPLIPRVDRLIRDMNVEWQDLWPEGTELSAAVSKAYARRSRLVHAGRTDHDALIRDHFRIHALAERTVARLCGVKDAWLHPSAYEHTYFIRESPI